MTEDPTWPRVPPADTRAAVGVSDAGATHGRRADAKATPLPGRRGRADLSVFTRWLPLTVAGAYALVSAAYISVSDQLAAASARSVADLQRIETAKGLGFVAITTVGVFLGAWFAGRRVRRQVLETLDREQIIVAQQGRILAGAMAASVAHDANNVLVSLLGEIESLVARGDARGLDTAITNLRTGVDRLVGLNGRLLGMPLEQARVDVVRIVRESLATIRAHEAVAGCHLECRAPASVEIETHPLLVHQIVGNLVLNAAEATHGRGRIEVCVIDGADGVVIAVHDDGPGIPADRREGLFESFASTKPGGFGLGLFSVRTCVDLLGGAVEVGDSPLGGAMFRVALPRRVLAPA